MKKRTHYSSEFKAKAAIDAIRGEKTIQELAHLYKVHPNQISTWKKELIDGASSMFDKKRKVREENESEDKVNSLYSQIGKLQVEKEFLKKKYRELYGTEPEL